MKTILAHHLPTGSDQRARKVRRRGLAPALLGLLVWAWPAAGQAEDGVVGWGANEYGQASSPAGFREVVAIAAGCCHSLALTAEGTVVGWGNNGWGQASPPAGLSHVVAIAAGSAHSLALTAEGTVVGWGDNGSGQASPPAGLSNVVAIAAGSLHSLALVSERPFIWRQPVSQAVGVGESVALEVQAPGSGAVALPVA